MRRALMGFGIAAAVILTVGAVVLSYASTRGPREMVGVIASPGVVVLEAHDQLGAQAVLVLDSVVVPGDSWIGVYTEGMGGMPGTRVGVARVASGRSMAVEVPFEPDVRLTENVIVVVHADRGVRGRFEYDAERFDASPDKPYWVGGRTVEEKVWVRFFEMGNAFRS